MRIKRTPPPQIRCKSTIINRKWKWVRFGVYVGIIIFDGYGITEFHRDFSFHKYFGAELNFEMVL